MKNANQARMEAEKAFEEKIAGAMANIMAQVEPAVETAIKAGQYTTRVDLDTNITMVYEAQKKLKLLGYSTVVTRAGNVVFLTISWAQDQLLSAQTQVGSAGSFWSQLSQQQNDWIAAHAQN